ncbi:hypothetical protein G9464_08955 [Halostella sp. JP-L12]|uniref:DUF7504 family protein n=1 Tax=Halostella TaxID=1843185 RepID=UPI000EF79D49|nr:MULTISPECIES: hypothetical protein [Halostella]NHN47724.1 hypothetical protein [Halostella sp. JP-L12]
MHGSHASSTTSVLIAGPRETGQPELAFDALSRSGTAVVVAPDGAASTVESWFEGRAAGLRVVSPTDGAGDLRSLSELGVAIHETLEAVRSGEDRTASEASGPGTDAVDDAGVWIAIDELPELLPDGDLLPLFRFFHVLHHRVERADGRLVCTVDTDHMGASGVRTLEEVFDRRRITRSDALAERPIPS